LYDVLGKPIPIAIHFFDAFK